MRHYSVAAIAAVSAIVFTQFASAADLPARTPSKAPLNAPPPFSWTGCYVGAQGGYKWANSDPSWQNSGSVSIPNGTALTSTQRPDGGVVGGTVGCNYQWTPNWVVGVEGDYSWANLSSEDALLLPANTTHSFGIKEHSFGT